jgi:hypothetical protein
MARKKTNKPLAEQNMARPRSLRSQWVAEVSQLKQRQPQDQSWWPGEKLETPTKLSQLKHQRPQEPAMSDGNPEMDITKHQHQSSRPDEKKKQDSPKMSWNELEAKLSKRMREPTPKEQSEPSSRERASKEQNGAFMKEQTPKGHSDVNLVPESEQARVVSKMTAKRFTAISKQRKGKKAHESRDIPEEGLDENALKSKKKPISSATKQKILSVVGKSASPSMRQSPRDRDVESAAPALGGGEDESNPPTSRAQKKSRNAVLKTKGTLSWLRKALAPKDTPKDAPQRTLSCTQSSATNKSSVDEEPEIHTGEGFHPTSPLQLQLWLSAANRAIAEAQAPVVPKIVISEDSEVCEDPTVTYYQHTQDTGVYVDYSTFDDGESVSSIDLLFKWLTCRDLNEKEKKTAIRPPGTVVATDTNVSDELSLDTDAKPRRRTLFSR